MNHPRIIGFFYAPPLIADDPRSGEVIIALETALPGIRLDHEVTAALTRRRLADRDEFLRVASHRRELPALITGDDSRYVRVHGNEMPGVLMPLGAPLWTVWLSLPLSEEFADLDAAMGNVGRASGAYWGAASPEAASAIIATQTSFPHLPSPLPLGLPGLRPPAQLRDPYVPHRLGWINYWSGATARLLGFPDAARDHELLLRSHPVGSGWIVRLTDDPLELGREDHVDQLRWAYARFPQIGGREP